MFRERTCFRPPLQERRGVPCTLPRGILGNGVLSASWQQGVPHRPGSAAPFLGRPSPCKVLTSVVSTANRAPPCNGRPSTTTSNRRLSSNVAVEMSKSRTPNSSTHFGRRRRYVPCCPGSSLEGREPSSRTHRVRAHPIDQEQAGPRQH